MRYIDFVNLSYKPGVDDLICLFYIEPEDISIEEAAGGVAAESSLAHRPNRQRKRSMLRLLQLKFSRYMATS